MLHSSEILWRLGETARARSNRRSLLKQVTAAGLALTATGALGSVASADMGSTMQPAPTAASPFTLYDPRLPSVEPGPKAVGITIQDATVPIAQGVSYATWTFDGQVPGHTVWVVEDDTVTMTIRNKASMAHSLDTHAAKTPPNVNYKVIPPGGSYQWSFVATSPGAFMYHCGTAPTLLHMASGMYGAMIVDPKGGWSPAQECILVQSAFYIKPGLNGVAATDFDKVMAYGAPDYVAFNGYANQYSDHPIQVKVGQPVRVFVVNAGPNLWTSFHVIGTIFDRVYADGNPANVLHGLQSISIGPAGGAVVEFTLDEPGSYTAVDHGFVNAAHGALAVFQAA